jgi:hypothetical protein
LSDVVWVIFTIGEWFVRGALYYHDRICGCAQTTNKDYTKLKIQSIKRDFPRAVEKSPRGVADFAICG